MPTANGRKGAETERMVAKYFREHGYAGADRRLREGRTDDQGDIDGVPFTTIQVKYVAQNRLQAWVADTLKQRDTAGTPLCLLVVRTKYRAVEGWDAYTPPSFWIADWEDSYDVPIRGRAGALDEREAWTWVRTDLRLAVLMLHRYIRVLNAARNPHLGWGLSSRTTWPGSTGKPVAVETPASAPSTENDDPPSPTT